MWRALVLQLLKKKHLKYEFKLKNRTVIKNFQEVPCCGVGVPHCEEQSLMTVPLADNTKSRGKEKKILHRVYLWWTGQTFPTESGTRKVYILFIKPVNFTARYICWNWWIGMENEQTLTRKMSARRWDSCSEKPYESSVCLWDHCLETFQPKIRNEDKNTKKSSLHHFVIVYTGAFIHHSIPSLVHTLT